MSTAAADNRGKRPLDDMDGAGTGEAGCHREHQVTECRFTSERPVTWALQMPGDIVYIPHGTWHCVLNLEQSVAYTRNFINRLNLKLALNELRAPHGQRREPKRESGLCMPRAALPPVAPRGLLKEGHHEVDEDIHDANFA